MLKASNLHYALAHPQALAASQRLEDRLCAAIGRAVGSRSVADLVVTCFSRSDFEMAAAWKQAEASTSWWVASFLDMGSAAVRQRLETINLARSPEEGVAFCLDELGMTQLQACWVECEGKGWIIRNEIDVMARIVPVEYTEVAPERDLRAEQLLEGVRSFGENARLAGRLRGIPGLASLADLSAADEGAGAYGAAILRTPRSMVKALRRNVADGLGIDLGQGQAQECLAALFGFASWNELVALEHQSSHVAHPITVTHWHQEGPPPTRRHFRTAAGGLIGFADTVLLRDARALFCELHAASEHGGAGLELMAVTARRASIEMAASPVVSCAGGAVIGGLNEEVLLATRRAMEGALSSYRDSLVLRGQKASGARHE